MVMSEKSFATYNAAQIRRNVTECGWNVRELMKIKPREEKEKERQKTKCECDTVCYEMKKPAGCAAYAFSFIKRNGQH